MVLGPKTNWWAGWSHCLTVTVLKYIQAIRVEEHSSSASIKQSGLSFPGVRSEWLRCFWTDLSQEPETPREIVMMLQWESPVFCLKAGLTEAGISYQLLLPFQAHPSLASRLRQLLVITNIYIQIVIFSYTTLICNYILHYAQTLLGFQHSVCQGANWTPAFISSVSR